MTGEGLQHLKLHNPHSVLAAIETRPKDVLALVLPKGADDKRPDPSGGPWKEARKACERAGIRIRIENQPEIGGSRVGRKTAIYGLVRARQPISLDRLLEGQGHMSGRRIWLALDCLQDPQNVGSIFRTAAFFGVAGVLMTADRSAALSEVVYDIASGGVEHVPFSVEVNLRRALDSAKERGIWILGTSEHSDQSVTNIKRDRDWMIVVGNEETGMRDLTFKSCDITASIPAQGGLGSLNASVATAIVISYFSLQA